MATVTLLRRTDMSEPYSGTATDLTLLRDELDVIIDTGAQNRDQSAIFLGSFEYDGFNNVSGTITGALIDTSDPGFYPNFMVENASFSVERSEDYKLGDYNSLVEGVLSGNDRITGSAGDDTLAGFAGNDTYIVNTSNDSIVEKPGSAGGIDTVISSDHYLLPDNVEAIELVGTRNLDAVGNELDNRLTGNAGRNFLSGDEGEDTFRFSIKLTPRNIDHITDFARGEDTIELENSVFRNLAPNRELAPFAFKNIALGVQDQNDRILYNHRSGWVYYDADGKGGQAAVHFATVNSAPDDPRLHPLLTSADFFVV